MRVGGVGRVETCLRTRSTSACSRDDVGQKASLFLIPPPETPKTSQGIIQPWFRDSDWYRSAISAIVWTFKSDTDSQHVQ